MCSESKGSLQVRHVGVSNETSYGVMRFIQAAEQSGLPRIVSIQNAYNLLVRSAFDTDLAEVCAPRQSNVGLMAYSPLAGGALSGKYALEAQAPENSRFNLFPGKLLLPVRLQCSLTVLCAGKQCWHVGLFSFTWGIFVREVLLRGKQ